MRQELHSCLLYNVDVQPAVRAKFLVFVQIVHELCGCRACLQWVCAERI